ncbi:MULTISPECIES: transcription antitermination factor NusB [Nocardiopsis]|jgi:N utilization substance protein B|uniref:Transcription antitermination protein NusB n=1 Tax=Nocardiopsis dassonvillei (strain ATCC 23218 / DSM 43111 / CIP 107115 / JCM 7437 / KCTC 9190 / NBRC 14626 / NCTC 10488 / NRRL B-5397 / IMRU 509) TaxID=446468 RepID=D7AZN2_NOCDD|nr:MULTISPECIES: transcription antitermination factor NusB [Nocardiopsis]PDP88808.1 transcription antitermination factor NusB [Glycomyces fuscus]ADH66324.1 NusB antitermination factor [Nocardiopsis dassonvillei subsp. dassonvillei DSM 43111]APC34645.1 N utilization substance protein B [Nocardiopsis dassonvillei]ASU57510.1 N utilization substance protein B [Nocardiopsis dassonvillei]MCP3016759.1 transcription antitermination factor NusB [Nocardiopsis dassonvillei]
MSGARRKARRRAVEVLYEAEVRATSVEDVIRRRRAQPEPPINDFTESLARSVDERRERIDELLDTYAIGWTLERMPVVDRNILRMGAYELLWADDIPDGVAIAEAVGVAKELSTDESPNFVSGLLSRLMENKSTLSL